ncbi:hypothetical protein KY290_021201 [Solanum tuberosum]|uniref:Uncharacterized protein n=1 Tax=Solanum tuberosum TaxID=4113 RepID=A0ABQ7V1U3_SOLTU|nr:hypothetical protein KY289_020369 [Solanum tuberosum]KAH0693028.1 hypothetical protein KY285_020125 [Solanum tuberosum]KAH0757708.1 hypothetical protein KY290_021201 [Solanum tuberosum]
METENKFEALKESEDMEAAETELKEIPSTRKWGENVFKKSNREEGQGDMLEQVKESMKETNQEQKERTSGEMGESSALTVWQPNMNELTPDQKRRCQEEEEDEDLEMNILSVGKAGDLSPRQIADLKCGFKKGRTGQSIVPLQVRTRRSMEREDTISQ